jgi:hypothetical protein
MSVRIQTKHAPLTRGQGTGKLAEVSDVEVLADGIPQEIESLDAVNGWVYLKDPVPVGSEVRVRYHYTSNPVVPFSEIGTEGRVFNQYGTSTQTKFPYQLKFLPAKTRQPLERGYTYTAFQRHYTGVLNDPTGLLFNENPLPASLPPFERETSTKFISFEGSDYPASPWERVGPVHALQFQEGLFVLDDSSGSVDAVTGSPLFYKQDVDVSYPFVANLNFRLKVFTSDNIRDFTGVSAGLVSQGILHLLGFLEVEGVKFGGLLGKGDESLYSSYLGLPASVEVRSDGVDTFTDIVRFGFRPDLEPGQRVLISGQVFQVLEIEPSTTADHFDARLSGELPLSSVVQVFPEIPYDVLNSYRMFRDETGKVFAYTRGRPSPFAIALKDDLPFAEEIFETLSNNQVFFGSLSRQARSRTGWDFLRCSIIPLFPSERSSSVYVSLLFDTLPEMNLTHPWILLDNQGFAEVLPGNQLLMEQAGRLEQGSFTYGRVEPFLTSQTVSDLQARLRVDSFAQGMASTLTIADERKEVTIGLFAGDPIISEADYATYIATSGTSLEAPAESLVTKGAIIPVTSSGTPLGFSTSYSGTQSFASEGWQGFLAGTTSQFIDQYHHIVGSGALAPSQVFFEVPEKPGLDFTSHLFSVRWRWVSGTVDTNGQLPLWMGADDTDTEVFLSFVQIGGVRKVCFSDKAGNLVTDGFGDPVGADFDWDDTHFHTYRVVRSGDVVSLFIDGTFRLSTTATQLSTSSLTGKYVLSLFLGEDPVVFDLDYFFSHSLVYGPRRVGLFMGGDIHDPSSYDFVEYDWLGQFLDLRVKRDPAGKTQVFLNGSLVPSFVRQYNELPNRTSSHEINTDLGFVRFGNSDPRAFTRSIWELLKYSIRNPRKTVRTLPHSVFNSGHVLSSPEGVSDSSLEEVSIPCDTLTQIFLSSKGLRAQRVLSVTSEEDQENYAFEFLEDRQEIHLTAGEFPNPRASVKVKYLAKPFYGPNYLKDQIPVSRLNEGTPPFPLSLQKVLEITSEVLPEVNEPQTILGEGTWTVIDGIYKYTFSVADETLFESLDLRESVIRGEANLLSAACDDQGWTEIGIDWEGFTDQYQIPDQKPEGAGTFDQPFLLDNEGSVLDSTRNIVESLSNAEINASLSDVRSEGFPTMGASVLPAVITVFEGFILDNTLLDSEEHLDAMEGTPETLDFLFPYNYP